MLESFAQGALEALFELVFGFPFRFSCIYRFVVVHSCCKRSEYKARRSEEAGERNEKQLINFTAELSKFAACKQRRRTNLQSELKRRDVDADAVAVLSLSLNVNAAAAAVAVVAVAAAVDVDTNERARTRARSRKPK